MTHQASTSAALAAATSTGTRTVTVPTEPPTRSPRAGTLVVVGTGAEPHARQPPSDHACEVLGQADKVLYLTRDHATERWLRSLRQDAEALAPFQLPGLPPFEVWLDMAEWTLSYIRLGLYVTVLAHPYPDPAPAHVITATVTTRGYPAVMIPAARPRVWLDDPTAH